LRRLDLQIHGHTKFCMVARYRLADLLFISSPQGMLRPAEMPPGWGLLEFPLEWLEGRSNDRSGEHGPGLVSVRLRHAGATPELTRPDHRLRLLRNIAVAATLRLEADAGCRGRVPAEFRVAVHDPHPVVAWEKEGGPASDAGPPG
jgi:hypothetical protein